MSASALLVISAALVAGGCTSTAVTEYGREARDNFVNACTEEVINGARGTFTTAKLARPDYCLCVYTAMKDKYKLSFSELMDYEEEVASAKTGEQPTPPPKLTKSMDSCNVAGPGS